MINFAAWAPFANLTPKGISYLKKFSFNLPPYSNLSIPSHDRILTTSQVIIASQYIHVTPSMKNHMKETL